MQCGGKQNDKRGLSVSLAQQKRTDVKSNAVVAVRDGRTLGVGAGQMNRVGSARIALEEARAKALVAEDAAQCPVAQTVLLARNVRWTFRLVRNSLGGQRAAPSFASLLSS